MRALITGISGQDGHFTARNLLARGYEVIGLTSDPAKPDAVKAEFPGEPVAVEAFDYLEPGAIAAVVERARPALIFNFAARSTGSGMFDAPFEMARVNGGFVLDLLEAIRRIDPAIALCQASSAEMYGDTALCPQDEATPFRPKSPYGAAKVYAHHLIGIYRNTFGMRCSAAILYNHESVRRSTAFVTRKIAHAAAAIKLGLESSFTLDGVAAERDWGYAPEYADAMVRMALAAAPRDYVVATGRLTSVAEACRICFSHVGLDYRDHLRLDEDLKRPVATGNLRGDPSAIARDLGWTASVGIGQVLAEMVDSDLTALAAAAAGTPS